MNKLKALGKRVRRITAIVLCVAVFLGITPEIAVTSFATSSKQSVLTGEQEGADKLLADYNYDGKDIVLKWNKILSAKKYGIFVNSSENDKFELVAETEDNSYKIINAKKNVTYEIIIRYFENETWNEENKSNALKIVSSHKVSSLKASAYGNTVTLSWSDLQSGNKYNVYSFNKAKGKYSLIKSTSDKACKISSLAYKTSYTFTVSIKYSATEGEYSAVSTSTTIPSPKAKATASGTSVTISWGKVSGAKEYGVWSYNISTKKYSRLGTTSKTSYIQKGLKSGTKYYYLVRANSAGVWSSYTVADNVSVYTVPNKPKIIFAVGGIRTGNLCWEASAGATSYNIYKYDFSKSAFVKVANTKQTTYTVKVPGQADGCGWTYIFLVRAVNAAGSSSYSFNADKQVISSEVKQDMVVTDEEILNSCKAEYYKRTGYQLSTSREKIIKTAISKRNRVPYYMGGGHGIGYTLHKGENNPWNTIGKTSYSDSNTYRILGLDCSGYVHWTYWTALDYKGLNGLTYAQSKNSTTISASSLLPGDLGFTKSVDHVGIYLYTDSNGNKVYIHSNGASQNITISQGSGFTEYRRAKNLSDKRKNTISLPVSYSKISVKAKAYASSVALSWNKVENAETYNIYLYNKTEKTYKKYTNVKSNSCNVKSLKGGTVYYFLVAPIIEGTEKRAPGDYSVLVSTLSVAPAVKAKGSINAVNISWNKVSGATGYGVWIYNPQTKKYTFLCNTTKLSYIHKNRKNSTVYYYLVRSLNSGGYSSFSVKNVVNAKTSKFGGPAVSISGGDEKVSLKWTKIDGARYYRIWKYADGKYTKIADTKELSYTVKNLKINAKYSFVIRAKKAFSWTDYNSNNIVSATTTEYKLTAVQKNWTSSKLNYLAQKYGVTFIGESKQKSGGKLMSNLISRDYKFILGSFYMENYFKSKRAAGYNELSYYYSENLYGSKIYFIWSK